MRILHVIDSQGFYGAEAMITDLAQEQDRTGDNPIVCSLIRSGQPAPEIVLKVRGMGLESVSLELDGNIFKQGQSIIHFALKNDIQIIHSHGYRPSILLGLQLKKLGMKWVRTLHGWTHTGLFSKMYLYALIDALLLWRQDAVVIVSKKMRQLPLLRYVPKRLITHIANGISISPNKLFTVNELKNEKWEEICKENFVIGSIGRLSAEKSQSDMIKVVAELRKKYYRVALIIIGEGTERDNLEALAHNLGVSDYVCLPGYKDNASGFLTLFDLFCLSSLTEGLPITVLEAMRQGVPVLATKVGALTDLLSESRGFLIEPKDIMNLEKKICLAMSDPSLVKSTAELAKDYFNCHYTSEIMAKNYQNVYNKTWGLNRKAHA